MSVSLKEKLLLYRLRVKKDPEAFAALYDSYVQRIYRFIFFKVSSAAEAEDIASEVFLKVWHYIQNAKEVKSFSGLLYRIARNCVIDHYRARANRPEVELHEETEITDGGKWMLGIHAKIENENLVKALKRLKQEYQEVITLKYIDELETEEIAEITGKGKVAVRVTLHRAVHKLRELMRSDIL